MRAAAVGGRGSTPRRCCDAGPVDRHHGRALAHRTTARCSRTSVPSRLLSRPTSRPRSTRRCSTAPGTCTWPPSSCSARSPPTCPGCCEDARSRGLTTSLDTNFDPAERWDGVTDLLPHLDLLLPNRARGARPGHPVDRSGARRRRGGGRGPRRRGAAGGRQGRRGRVPCSVDPSGNGAPRGRHAGRRPWTPPAPATPSTPPTSTRSCAASTRRSACAVPASPARSPPRPSAAPPASRPSTSSHLHSGKGRRCPTSALRSSAQPAAWRRAVDAAAVGGAALPQPGGAGRRDRLRHVVVHGRGVRRAARGRGLGETDFFPASRLPTSRRYDRVVAISRSGTTTEVLDALAGSAARRTSIVADAVDPDRRASATTASCSTSPTSSRSSRPSSPPRR